MKNLYNILFITTLTIFNISCTSRVEIIPKATEGFIDLREWNFNRNGNIKLDGQWKFLWNKLVMTDGLYPEVNNLSQNESFMTVPGLWNDSIINNKKIDGHGYATYALKVALPESAVGQYFSFKLRDQATAYNLYINGMKTAQNGKVAKNREAYEPEYLHLIKTIRIDKPELNILIEVANFTHQKGGIWESILFGKEEQIQQTKNSNLAFDLFTFGAIIIMSIYHFGLFILRRNEKSTLYFGLFTLFLAIRTLFRGEMFITTLVPGINFFVQVAIEYISFYWSVPIFLLFMNVLFPKEFKRIITLSMLIIAALFTLSVLILPMEWYTKGMIYFQLISLLEGIYIIIGLIVATVRKREGALPAIVGWIIFFLAVINDVLYMNNTINTGEFFSLGLFIFIFSQSFILSLRFSQAFFSVERLSENLHKLNIANSRFVPKQVLSFLKKNSIIEIELGDHIQKEMTILFSDIRKFTTLSEVMSPEENFKFLNSYLSRISPVISGEEGFIDKYLGDGIMALFPNRPEDAVKAAIKMQKEIIHYNNHRSNQNYEPIKTGIGIHTGVLMLGTIGEQNRIDATVISDSVNLASRVEALTKLFGAAIIITESVLQEISDKEKIHFRNLGNVKVTGKQKSILIYEILDGCEDDIKNLKIETKEIFENAVYAYIQKELNAAIEGFRQVLQKNPKDKAAKYYYKRAMFHLDHQDIEWDSSEIKIK